MILLAVIYMVFISLGLPDSIFGVAWPVIHTDFGVQESFASIYMIIIALTTGGVSFFAGKLIQKFGTAKVTLISIVLTVISLVGISFAPNLVVMMIFSIIGGYGAGAIDTGLNNYVSLHYEARHMSWLHCFWGVGVTVSPVIMSFFLGDGNWRAGYRAVAAIQAVIMLFVVLYVNRWDKLEKLSAKAETTGEESGEKQNIFKIKGVVTSILSLGLYCSMEFLLGTWGATFLVNAHSCSPEIAARWVSLYYGGIMLGRLISGFLSMRVNDKMLIRLGSAVSFAGIVLLALPLKEISFFGLLLIGTGFGPIFPSVLHTVPENFGKANSADITGKHMGGAYAIGFTVQLVFGYVAEATSFGITPFVLLAICAGLMIAREITNKRVKR